MKKRRTRPSVVRDRSEVLAEYDFGRGRRNKYATRYEEGTNVVVLDPDVAIVFRNAREVNAALRALVDVIQRYRKRRTRSRRNV